VHAIKTRLPFLRFIPIQKSHSTKSDHGRNIRPSAAGDQKQAINFFQAHLTRIQCQKKERMMTN
jgi:hypothetical protein